LAMQAVFLVTSEKFQFMASKQWVTVLVLINSVSGYSVQVETKSWSKKLPGTSATRMLELQKT
jgi:hypothetical protein